MKTHDNQKPFQCNVCNRGYNTAAALTSHMQGHKRDREGREPDRRRALRCLRCGDAFRRPDLLQVCNSCNSDIADKKTVSSVLIVTFLF